MGYIKEVPKPKSSILGGTQMRSYDIFEKFPDGCSIWRACASGQSEALRKMQELAEHSENEFFVVDLLSQAPLPSNLPPRNSPEIAHANKRIG